MVVTWLNRGTLHLVGAEDYWWLEPLTARLAVGNARRLRQEGVSDRQAARGVEVVADALAATGPQTREQLRRRLDDAGVPTAGQALVHVLLAATLRSRIVRGPMIGSHHTFVSPEAWLGRPPPRSTIPRPSPAWPAATWSATARPPPRTSPIGPA